MAIPDNPDLDALVVQTMGAGEGATDNLLSFVRDPITGRYLAPPPLPVDNQLLEARRAIWGPEENISAENLALRDRLARERMTLILDTGVIAEHPRLADRLIDQVDFTGEGAEDYYGHGTIVSLLWARGVPEGGFISVKVLDRDGNGSPKSLIRGLTWAKEYRTAHPELTHVLLNLSAGVYSTRWLGGACHGTCRVCRAAIDAAEAGVMISAAAGNSPGRTACPATAGSRAHHGLIMAVASTEASSGIGTVRTEGTVEPFVPI